VPQIDPAALGALMDYEFPGNVRELENILERAFTLCENAVIRVEDLRLPASGEVTESPLEGLPEEFDPDAGESLESFLEGIERKALVRALELERWNRTAAAARLGMSFRQIRYRLKKLGID
jgi:two-component system response regulator PilR (NtrC family)